MNKPTQTGWDKITVDLPCIPDFMTVKDAARIIGVSEVSIYKYIYRGILPAARVCGVIVVDEKAVHAYQRPIRGHSGAKLCSMSKT